MEGQHDKILERARDRTQSAIDNASPVFLRFTCHWFAQGHLSAWAVQMVRIYDCTTIEQSYRYGFMSLWIWVIVVRMFLQNTVKMLQFPPEIRWNEVVSSGWNSRFWLELKSLPTTKALYKTILLRKYEKNGSALTGMLVMGTDILIAFYTVVPVHWIIPRSVLCKDLGG